MAETWNPRRLSWKGSLLRAYRTTNEPSFILERRSLQAAPEFGAQYNCDFRFDALVGAGIFTELGQLQN